MGTLFLLCGFHQGTLIKLKRAEGTTQEPNQKDLQGLAAEAPRSAPATKPRARRGLDRAQVLV